MKKFQNSHFEGERALFQTFDAEISRCLFDNGESPLKESRNLEVSECVFAWKYPFWYDKSIRVSHCRFEADEHAGIWYTEHAEFVDCEVIGPKNFRRCKDLTLENCNFSDAKETLWWNQRVKVKNCTFVGPYVGMLCTDLEIENIRIDGDYAFDGCKNLKIKNSILNSKDAFWNCENVMAENCEISGEYIGWNSKNLTLKNCIIHSHQGFCYIENLTLINCKIESGGLLFEYCSNIDADIDSELESIKNPISGIIRCRGAKEIIRDDNNLDHGKTEVLFR